MTGEVVGPRSGVLTISATSYKLSAQHNKLTLVFTSGSPIAFLIPVGLPNGIRVKIVRVGAGLITFSTESGVSLNNVNSQTTSGAQYAVLDLEAIGTDNYVLSGDVPGGGGGGNDTVETGIAAAGTDQPSATLLAAVQSYVSAGINGTAGVRLYVGAQGGHKYVTNEHATSVLPLYPASGVTINNLAVNLPYDIQPNTTAELIAKSPAAWRTVP